MEFIDCCESGDDEDADGGDVDTMLGADDGALQWKTHRDESLNSEEQNEIAGTDLRHRRYPLHYLASGEVVSHRLFARSFDQPFKLVLQRKSVDDRDGNEHRHDLNVSTLCLKKTTLMLQALSSTHIN